MTDALRLIEALTNAYGPSGFEDDVTALLRAEAPENAVTWEDSLRNLYIRRKADTEQKPVIQLDAHSDEVGFMVQAIHPNGTLRFLTLGGWVNCNIPAHRVRVKTRYGTWIPGIIAAKPPHFMTAEERNRMPSVPEMVIDIGAESREEAMEDFGIRPGAPAVPDVTFEYDARHDLMLGKAFDNRLGCAAVLKVFECLADEKLNVNMTGAVASQEEMGTRGAYVTANHVKPDIAIVFEGSPADDTVAESYMIQTALHRGPMLRHIDARMITNPRFQRWALDLAEELHIPVQEAVRSGGSTNGAPIHLSNLGVPCIVIGFPSRYIHSHYGMASLRDFENGVRLGAEIVRRLDESVIRSF